MLGLCIDHLKSGGYPGFAILDVDKPEDGGVKFAQLKEKVEELLEELGTVRQEMGSQWITEKDKPTEEQKKEEQSPGSQRIKFDQNDMVIGKKLTYGETPIKANPQSQINESAH